MKKTKTKESEEYWDNKLTSILLKIEENTVEKRHSIASRGDSSYILEEFLDSDGVVIMSGPLLNRKRNGRFYHSYGGQNIDDDFLLFSSGKLILYSDKSYTSILASEEEKDLCGSEDIMDILKNKEGYSDELSQEDLELLQDLLSFLDSGRIE